MTIWIGLLLIVLIVVLLVLYAPFKKKSSSHPDKNSTDQNKFTPHLKHYNGRVFDFENGGFRQVGMHISRDAIEIRNSSGVVSCDCGHMGYESFELHLLGVTYTISGSKRCPNCTIEYFIKDVIRCASCGLPILPDEPIALYGLEGKHHPWTCYISKEGEPSKSVIGCLRWECCDSGAYFAGHWSVDGFRPIYGHGGTMLDECLKTEQSVCANPQPAK